MKKDKIVWKEPPPKGKGPGRPSKIRAMMDALIANPGEWALVQTYAKGTTAHTCARNFRMLHGDKLEIIARGPEVYCRFIGELNSENANGKPRK